MSNPIDARFKTVTRYHYLFFGLYLSSRFPSIWHILNFLFLSPTMDYTCGGTSNDTLNKCPCDDPVWDYSVFTKTMQSKFGIYCDNAWLISFSESAGFFGMVVGSMVFGAISDRFGRLLCYCLCGLIVGTTGCLVSVMPTVVFFIIMRFLEGFGEGGVVVSGYVLCIEYCGLRYRETVSALIHIPNNLGHIAIAGVSYLLRNCDHFQLAISIPMFIPATYYFLLLESPRWLLDNNKRERAVIVMEKFCKFNKGTDCDSVRTEIEQFRSPTENREVMKFHHIFKHKRLCINLVCMSYLYFICGAGYYGVSQFIGKMSGNVHINTAVGGLFLVPGSLLGIVLLNKLKRKTFLMLTNISSGALILIVICIPANLKPTWIRVLLAGISNAFFYMSFSVIFLYCVELFPTSARNSALGFLSFISRIGQVSAPQINTLPQTAAGIIFGVSAILGVVVAIPLPETKNTELPSTIEDIQRTPQQKDVPIVLQQNEKEVKINSKDKT